MLLRLLIILALFGPVCAKSETGSGFIGVREHPQICAHSLSLEAAPIIGGTQPEIIPWVRRGAHEIWGWDFLTESNLRKALEMPSVRKDAPELTDEMFNRLVGRIVSLIFDEEQGRENEGKGEMGHLSNKVSYIANEFFKLEAYKNPSAKSIYFVVLPHGRKLTTGKEAEFAYQLGLTELVDFSDGHSRLRTLDGGAPTMFRRGLIVMTYPDFSSDAKLDAWITDFMAAFSKHDSLNTISGFVLATRAYMQHHTETPWSRLPEWIGYHDGILYLDRPRTILFLNSAAEAVRAYVGAQLVGDHNERLAKVQEFQKVAIELTDEEGYRNWLRSEKLSYQTVYSQFTYSNDRQMIRAMRTNKMEIEAAPYLTEAH